MGTIIFLIAFAAGFITTLFYYDRELVGDEQNYHELAQGLLKNNFYGFPGERARRAPLYPMALSVFYLFGGSSTAVGYVLQNILGALMVLLAFLIVSKIHSRLAGIVAAVFVMLESYWWLNQVELMQENICAVLICFSLLLVLKERYCLSGIVLGFSILAKPMLLPLIVVLWLLYVFSKNKKHILKPLVLFSLCFMLPVFLWSVRNKVVLGSWIVVSSHSTYDIYVSNRRELRQSRKGLYIKPEHLISPTLDYLKSEPNKREVASYDYWKEKAIDEVKHIGVLGMSQIVFWKVVKFFSPSVFFEADTIVLKIFKGVLILLNSMLLLGFFFSIIKKKPYYWLALVLVLSMVITVMVVWGSIRFRYVLHPVIALWSATTFVDYLKSRKYVV